MEHCIKWLSSRLLLQVEKDLSYRTRKKITDAAISCVF